MSERMKFSVAFPMIEAAHFLPLAQRAEQVGFDAVAVPESVFYPEVVSAKYPYTPDGDRFWPAETPFLDPFVAIPAMAAVTTTLNFYTNVLKLAIREPLLVAKALMSAAVLSGDRVGIGVGLSWIPEEFEWLHQNMRTRGKRTDEAIAILRLVASGEFEEFHGDYYDFDRLMIRPAPTSVPPIYVGGLSEAGLRRAATLGDGWISVLNSTEEVSGIVERLGDLRREYGRDTEPFEIKVIASDAADYDGFRRLADVGVTDIMVCPWYFIPGDVTSLDHQLEGLDHFADTVITRFAQ